MKSNAFSRRIKTCQAMLRASGNQSVLLLSSHPPVIRSHDTHYPYKQQSDFYYLTGSEIQNSALLISSKLKHPILFAPPIDAHKTLWEGKQPNPKNLAQQLGAELKVSKDIRAEVLAALRGHDQLLFQNIPGSLSFKITSELIAMPSHARGNFPSQFSHSDVLLERQRLFKDAEEVETIKAANEVTSEALLFVAAKIQPGQYEYEVARTLEYIFGMNKCGPAFNSIIAAGKNAATLHYEALHSKIGKEDMVLIDSGAQLDHYCADITRMLPASGRFSPIHKCVYETVLAAQYAALKKVRHGVKIAEVYNAATEVLVEGLCELKVLRGTRKSILKNKTFKPYFPHGIGHSLGLDVHDLSQLRGNNEAVLEAGMVFTIEPGLYFAKAQGQVPACGVRIEDNVLVTTKGCEILSPGFPKETDEIEALMAEHAQ